MTTKISEKAEVERIYEGSIKSSSNNACHSSFFAFSAIKPHERGLDMGREKTLFKMHE